MLNLMLESLQKRLQKFSTDLTSVKRGWGTKFGMIKCRTTDIPEFQNYEY